MLKEDLFKSPVYSMLVEYTKNNPARFHMPGHKGSQDSPLYEIFGKALGFDVTELPETDNLFEPQAAFLEAEMMAARTYGARDTLFCTGGSTLSIETMLRLVTKRGGRVLCARNCHKAVINSLSLLGIEPIFVLPRPFKGSGLAGEIKAEDIEKILSRENDVAAVFITSPDYYGVISDISAISKVCRNHGVPLLVDNAHGAHLICFDGLHPIKLGADLCCDSAHKTLPALTGASYLHSNLKSITHDDAKDAMMLFGSTSPSYLISLSLDIARVWLETDGKMAFSELSQKVAKVRSFCENLGFFTPSEAHFDPVRIVIDTASRGITGDDAAEFLRKRGIMPEMSDRRHLVLIPTPFNSDDDFKRLEKALSELPLGMPLTKDCDFDIYGSLPDRKVGLREALFLNSETVDIEKSAGRISAQTKCPCPPCIPVVMPGEVISAKTAGYLKSYGVLSIKVLK